MVISGTLTVTPIISENYASSQTHEEIQNRECVWLECEVGKEAWIAVKIPEDTAQPWHRIHTSVVEDIRCEEDGVCLASMPPIYRTYHYTIIKTKNSIYKIIDRQ